MKLVFSLAIKRNQVPIYILTKQYPVSKGNVVWTAFYLDFKKGRLFLILNVTTPCGSAVLSALRT